MHIDKFLTLQRLRNNGVFVDQLPALKDPYLTRKKPDPVSKIAIYKHCKTWRNAKLLCVKISKSPPFSKHGFLSVKRSLPVKIRRIKVFCGFSCCLPSTRSIRKFNFIKFHGCKMTAKGPKIPGGASIHILGTGTSHREGYRFSRFWYKERYRFSRFWYKERYRFSQFSQLA